MDYNLLNLEDVLRKMGRGVVFYHAPTGTTPARWDPGEDLRLLPLGDTEGEITHTPNESIATLTLPEVSGSAVHEATVTGENPVLEIPLFLADPTLLPIVSPTGRASAGHFRVRDARELTLVVMPEQLFKLPGADTGFGTLSPDGGGWKLNDVVLTDEQEALLAMSTWYWRGYFSRAPRRFRGGHGDDAKNIESVQFTGMMHPDLPDGERLYTIGDPFLAGIDINPGS